jgi:hypothetical protein
VYIDYDPEGFRMEWFSRPYETFANVGGRESASSILIGKKRRRCALIWKHPFMDRSCHHMVGGKE